MGKKKRKKKISIEEEYLPFKNISNDKWERISDYINNNKYNVEKLTKLVVLYNAAKKKNKKIGKIKFTIDMVPKGTPRPRLNMFTKSIYVEGSKRNRNFFEKLINDHKIKINEKLIITPTKMNIKFFLPIPNSMTKYEKVLAELGVINHISKPDWDNLGKTTDMFTQLIWLDDSLVTDVRVKKAYSFKPRIEVKLKYLLDHDSKYNKNKIEKSISYKNIFSNKEEI